MERFRRGKTRLGRMPCFREIDSSRPRFGTKLHLQRQLARKHVGRTDTNQISTSRVVRNAVSTADDAAAAATAAAAAAATATAAAAR